MARSPAVSLLRSALLGATMLALFQPVLVQARVGVTSATDGDPKGKPPSEPERVLRIGIDVQANEIVTTGANDRAHLVFLDGTSVTVGPNAQLTIDKFVYDPATKTGDLAITASKGVFRLVGGKISKNNPVTITTPSSTIGIRGGITVFTVTDGQTTSTFVFGTSMTVTGQGVTQTAFKPGFQVTSTAGLPPGPPRQVPPGGLSASISSLEGGGSGGSGSGGSGSGGSGGNADGGAAGFGATNSAGGPGSTPPSTGGNSTPNTSNTLSNTGNQQVLNQNQTTTTTTTRTAYIDTPPPGIDTSLKGFVGGLVTQIDAGLNTSQRAVANGSPTDFKIETDPATNRAATTIIIRDFSQPGVTANFQLGSLVAGTNSFFVNDNRYFTTDSNPSTSKVTLPGEQPTDVGIGSNTALASASIIPLPAPLACTCAFLTWGTWTGQVDYTSQDFRPGEKDVLVNVPYVAGSMTPLAALDNLFNAANLPGAVQQNFIATYNGGFVGNVQFGNSAYSANGIYSNTWNFGTRSGVVTGSFDGLGISGQTVAINNGPGFNGPLVVTAPAGGTFVGGGSINGAFFSSATSAVAGQAGNFAVTGQRATPGQGLLNYQAAGIFAAQK